MTIFHYPTPPISPSGWSLSSVGYQRTGKRQEAHKHLTTATTMYREMDMRFWLEQAVVIVDGL
jgi:hypothetical protein